MRVKYGNESVAIKNILVGDTFLANRKSTNAKGLYMKIDGTCGLIKNKTGKIYAVNLETGQPREFDWDTQINKVIAEVVFPKK